MYIFVKLCFIFWYLHTKLYFLRYCFVSSSIVTNPIKVVIQPHLYSLSVVRTIVAGRKKGFRQTTLYWAIYQNPFVLSRFWHLYYFSFDSRTTVSTWQGLHKNSWHFPSSRINHIGTTCSRTCCKYYFNIISLAFSCTSVNMLL